MAHDKLRDDFVNRYVAHSRQKVDARNSLRFPKDFFQKVADLYNDHSWIPNSRVFNNSNIEFSTSVALRLQLNYQYTDTQVKERLGSARSAVMLVSTFQFVSYDLYKI